MYFKLWYLLCHILTLTFYYSLWPELCKAHTILMIIVLKMFENVIEQVNSWSVVRSLLVNIVSGFFITLFLQSQFRIMSVTYFQNGTLIRISLRLQIIWEESIPLRQFSAFLNQGTCIFYLLISIICFKRTLGCWYQLINYNIFNKVIWKTGQEEEEKKI